MPLNAAIVPLGAGPVEVNYQAAVLLETVLANVRSRAPIRLQNKPTLESFEWCYAAQRVPFEVNGKRMSGA